MTTPPINKFEGEYRFLSNFWPCAKPIYWDGLLYPTAEHAYQAAKTLVVSEQELIQKAETPGKAKRLGQLVTYNKAIDQHINGIPFKVYVMLMILEQKFNKNQDLMDLLKATGDAEIIEGNTWHDIFWGVCSCDDIDELPGKNWLGKLLMKIRDNPSANLVDYVREKYWGVK